MDKKNNNILTQREKETLKLITKGFCNKKIAEELKEKCRAFLKVTVNDSQKAQQALLAWRPNLKTEVSGSEVHITSRVDDTSEIVITLVNAGVRVYEMRNESIELEDFFIERLG